MASKVNILQNQKVMQPMNVSHVADISTTYVNFSIRTGGSWSTPTEVSLDKLFVKDAKGNYKPVKSYKDYVAAYNAGTLYVGAGMPKQQLKHDNTSVRIYDENGNPLPVPIPATSGTAYTKALSIPNTHTATESIGPDSIPYGLQRTAEMKQISTSAADHYLLLQLAGSDKWTYYKKSDIYYFDDSNKIQFLSSLNLKDPADLAKFKNRRLFAKSGDKSFEIGTIYTEQEYEFDKYKSFEQVSYDKKLTYEVASNQTAAASTFAAEASLPDDKKTVAKVNVGGVDIYCEMPKVEVLDVYYVEYTPKKITINDPNKPGATTEKHYYSAKMYQKNEAGDYVLIKIKGKPEMIRISDLYETEASTSPIDPADLLDYAGKSIKVKVGTNFVDTEILTYEELLYRYAKRRTFQQPVNTSDDVVSDKSYRQLKNGEYFKEKDLEPICLRQVDLTATPPETAEAYMVTYNEGGNTVSKIFETKEASEDFINNHPTLVTETYAMVYCAYRDCSVIQTTSTGAKEESCVIVGDIKDAGAVVKIPAPTDPSVKSNAKDKALADYAAGKYEIDFTFEVDKANFVPICYQFAYGAPVANINSYLVRFDDGTNVKEMVISKAQLDAKGGLAIYGVDSRYSFHPLMRTDDYENCDVVQTAITGSEMEHVQIFCDFDGAKYDAGRRIATEAQDKVKLKEKLVKGFKDGTYVIPEDEKVPYIKREMASNKRYIYTDETYLEDYEVDKGPYRGFNDHTVELTEKDGKYGLKSKEKEFSIKEQLKKDFAKLWKAFWITGMVSLVSGILVAMISPWLVAAPFIVMAGAAIVLPIKAIIQKVWHQFKDKLAADRNQWGKDATKKLENLNEYVNEESYDLGTILTKIEDSKNEILALSKGTPTEIPEIVDGKIKVDKNNARFVQNFKKLYKAECDELDNLNKQIEKLEKYLKKKYGANYRTNSKTPPEKIAELDALIADRDKIVAKLDGYLKSYEEKGEVYDTDPLRDEKLKQAQSLKTFTILKLYANDKLNNDDLKNALNALSLDISILKKLTYDSSKKQYIYVDNKIKVVFDAETGDLITNSKKVPATISTSDIKKLILKINSDVKPIVDKVALNEEGKVVYVTDGTSSSAEFSMELTDSVTYEVEVGEVLEAPVIVPTKPATAEELKERKKQRLLDIYAEEGITGLKAETKLKVTADNYQWLYEKMQRLTVLAKHLRRDGKLSPNKKEEFKKLQLVVGENIKMILDVVSKRDAWGPACLNKNAKTRALRADICTAYDEMFDALKEVGMETSDRSGKFVTSEDAEIDAAKLI